MPISLKPGAARIASPQSGISSSPRSSNGNKVLMTSVGARSTSSITTHRPSMTAVVKTPGCQLKDPGVLALVYMPISIFASVCSFRCKVTIDEIFPSSLAKSLMREVLPEPEKPVTIKGLFSLMDFANKRIFWPTVFVMTSEEGFVEFPISRGTKTSLIYAVAGDRSDGLMILRKGGGFFLLSREP